MTTKPILDKKTKKIKSIEKFGVFTTAINVIFHGKTFCQLMRFLHNAVHYFFIPQFAVKFKMRKIPVLHVDSELDYKIPFTPMKIKDYTQFLNLWISPLSFLFKRFGANKFTVSVCDEMMRLADDCYLYAYKVYGYAMSTTKRPLCKVERKAAANFHMIRTWDPHYMCVPSLHISIIVLAIFYFRNVFKLCSADKADVSASSSDVMPDNARPGDMYVLTQEEISQFNKEIYENGIRIAESVLFIKQHSVNCIAAALYMMRCCIPQLFTDADVHEFVQNLFLNNTDVTLQDAATIRSYILNLYEKFCNESEVLTDFAQPDMKAYIEELKGQDTFYIQNMLGLEKWATPVKAWLVAYKAYLP